MALDNDVRGWILTAISAVACCLGASIICIDLLVRRFPNMHNFKIAESDAFSSASLSLSAGVILFSSLYSMLPESKNYLKVGGYGPRTAGFLLIGLFLLGVFGIRILSQIIHKFIPSHVVDCDHNHDEEAVKHHYEDMTENEAEQTNGHGHHHHPRVAESEQNNTSENTPLLSGSTTPRSLPRTTTAPAGSLGRHSQSNGFVTAPNSRRPSSSFTRSLSKTFTRYISSQKEECDENGPCMGFSDPCGQDCFKIVQRRGTLSQLNPNYRRSLWHRLPSEVRYQVTVIEEDNREPGTPISPHEPRRPYSTSEPQVFKPEPRSCTATHHQHHLEHDQPSAHDSNRQSAPHHRPSHSHSHAGTTDHHHHVPTNAFLSLGLQTSVAIALHKAPEGFITFATNHANPKLGFTIFIALFIHNITEGFALSLPLFLALNSRFKAIAWASILGGLSQPIGAGLAALWFKLASSNDRLAPDEKVYGGIFAVTAGVMASVALSLITESLQLSHNKNTCIAFTFIGMGLLGFSMALMAD